MRPKGLRDLRTPRTSSRNTQGGSREQAVAELARLEHEKARLNRELDVWRRNMQRTTGQLEQVEARLAALREQIEGPDEQPAPRPARRIRHDDPEPPQYSTISLEY